jgi:murein DD-endopeptidase MepM/ murein hydrolase activator NlpD
MLRIILLFFLSSQLFADIRNYQIYTVGENETIYSIAKKFNVNSYSILNDKGLVPPGNKIKKGDVLKLPVAKNTFNFQAPLKHRLIPETAFNSDPENPHKGVTYKPSESSNVFSSMDGKVATIDYMDGYNNYVILEHANGFHTVYGNLDQINVAIGQYVKKGNELGKVSKKKGLYFQITQGSKPVDPQKFLN